jgi:hypothetical protein
MIPTKTMFPIKNAGNNSKKIYRKPVNEKDNKSEPPFAEV